jgi:DNA-binding NtrC family response regulator
VDDRVIDRQAILSTSITGVGPAPTSSGSVGRGNMPFQAAKEAAEKEYLIDLLRRHRFNVSAAARTAQIHRQSLHRLLRKHEIQASELE